MFRSTAVPAISSPRAEVGARRLPQQRRADRTPEREERDRAVSRSQCHRRRRARWPEARNLLAQDPFEALSIQIQGSARVILEDGTPLRINYNSHNGYPYTRGRAGADRAQPGAARGNVDAADPRMDGRQSRRGAEAAATNRSYVFFRITGLSNDGEPVGAQGVPLGPAARSRSTRSTSTARPSSSMRACRSRAPSPPRRSAG